MAKSTVIRIKTWLWDKICEDSFAYYGSRGAEQEYLAHLSTNSSVNPFKTPPKTGVAPEEEKKIKGPSVQRVLCHDIPTGLTGWTVRKDNSNKDEYNIIFYFFNERSKITPEMYGPCFRRDNNWEITEEMRALAKLMALERQAYLDRVVVPRGTSHMDSDTTELDRYNQERVSMIKKGGMKNETDQDNQ